MQSISDFNNPQARTLTKETAQERVSNFMEHAYAMIGGLSKQHTDFITSTGQDQQLEEVIQIYQKALKRLTEIEEALLGQVQLGNSPRLNKKEIKALAKNLKTAEKEVTKVLYQSQLSALHLLGARGKLTSQATQKRVAWLARGGIWAFLAKTDKDAQKIFNEGRQAMQNASSTYAAKQTQHLVPQSEYEQNRLEELSQYWHKNEWLTQRAGVIGLQGIYFFQQALTQSQMQKQYKAFIAQRLSDQQRQAQNFVVHLPEVRLVSRLTPLNEHFDARIFCKREQTGESPVVLFGKIFGKKGLSSASLSQERHLINGWESSLVYERETIYSALRHGIISNGPEAAQELLQAALLQEINDRNLTLEDLRKRQNQAPLTVNLNSLSLVTPDALRGRIGQVNERELLRRQLQALKDLQNTTQSVVLKVGNEEIKLRYKVNVNAFNFGVNAISTRAKMGLDFQYAINKQAFKGFTQQYEGYISALSKKIQEETDPTEKERLQHRLENAKNLYGDIKELLYDEKAYLQGRNQYEIGAKILILSNAMNQDLHNMGIPGIHCSINCKSGKDRTGIMDNVAKAFATMAALSDGHCPTHQELTSTDPDALKVQEKFKNILKQIMLESGGLEITRLNTGAMGYKVKGEANVSGMELEDFLEAQGLSCTTSY